MSALRNCRLRLVMQVVSFASAALFAGACERGPQASSEGGRPRCDPSCESAACGAPDGCGGTCPCDEDSCQSGRPCKYPECGMCAGNEVCSAGKCVCQPFCDASRACLADGCGGTCPCPDGYVQNAKGQWVAPEQCTDNCAVAGWTCGKLCGQDCGACNLGACALGRCDAPRCDGTRCDGGCACSAGSMCNAAGECVATEACTDTCEKAGASCGAICGVPCGRVTCDGALSCLQGACAPAVSCTACSLKLTLIDKTVFNGRLLEAVVAVDYSPTEGEPHPRLADLRIGVDGTAKLTSVVAGQALAQAKKELYVDSVTGNPWKLRPDGTYQVMLYSVGSAEEIPAGRLLTLRFAPSGTRPINLTLARREQTFAPQLADAALQSSQYDLRVVVTP